MKLLTSVFPRSGRILPAGGWFTLGLCGFLAGLEIAGRCFATTDFHDGLLGFALVATVLAVVARHRREPLGWVNGLSNWGKRFGGSIAGLRYDHGIDLRGTPPLPRRTPPAVWLLALLLLLWSGLALAAWTAFPTTGCAHDWLLHLVHRLSRLPPRPLGHAPGGHLRRRVRSHRGPR